MNAVAWAFKYPGDVNPSKAWAMYGTTVILATDDWDDQGWVYQWHYSTVEEAEAKCIQRAERADANKGHLAVGPYFIALPAQVMKEIRLNASGGRYPAPTLHAALFRLMA